MTKQYKAKVWATKTLLKEAEASVETILEALLPDNYSMKIERCDKAVPGYEFASHYTHCGTLRGKDGADVPSWIVYSHSVPGVKAKLLSLMFEGKPCSPLT